MERPRLTESYEEFAERMQRVATIRKENMRVNRLRAKRAQPKPQGFRNGIRGLEKLA